MFICDTHVQIVIVKKSLNITIHFKSQYFLVFYWMTIATCVEILVKALHWLAERIKL